MAFHYILPFGRGTVASGEIVVENTDRKVLRKSAIKKNPLLTDAGENVRNCKTAEQVYLTFSAVAFMLSEFSAMIFPLSSARTMLLLPQ